MINTVPLVDVTEHFLCDGNVNGASARSSAACSIEESTMVFTVPHELTSKHIFQGKIAFCFNEVDDLHFVQVWHALNLFQHGVDDLFPVSKGLSSVEWH